MEQPGRFHPATNSAAIAGAGSTQYVWGSAGFQNTEGPFRLERVGSQITFTFGQLANFLYRAELPDPLAYQVNFMDIRLRADANSTVTSSEVAINNLVLNGQSLGSPSALDTTRDGTPAVGNFVIGNISGDFVLTGSTVINWEGSGTFTNSPLAWQIKAYYGMPEIGTPEPASFALCGIVLLALGLVRRRSGEPRPYPTVYRRETIRYFISFDGKHRRMM